MPESQVRVAETQLGAAVLRCSILVSPGDILHYGLIGESLSHILSREVDERLQRKKERRLAQPREPNTP